MRGMKAYLFTTGGLFAVLALAHLGRTIAESSRLTTIPPSSSKARHRDYGRRDCRLGVAAAPRRRRPCRHSLGRRGGTDDRPRTAIAELQRLIEGIPVALVTTIAGDGMLRCRPMLLERVEADATLVFLTHLSSQKTTEVRRDARVNVAFQSDDGERYVSVSGRANSYP
jgi:hypothetical protein